MTEIGKQIKREVKIKKENQMNRQFIGQMSTKAILYYLLKRHSGDITCVILALGFGMIIGSRI